MKSAGFINCLLLFIFSFNLANCQRHKYAPGYDFKLFEKTPARFLAKAVENQDTAAISGYVVQDSVLLNYQEPEFGNTLLTLAIMNNMELAVTKLLELGADPNKRALDDSSPFLEACSNVFTLKKAGKVLRLLIKYGADVNAVQIDTTFDQFGRRKKFKTTALRALCIYGNVESVRVLVENGARLDTYGDNESAILSSAVLANKLQTVRYLMIDRKAPIPDYVTIRQPGTRYEKRMTITDILNEKNRNDSDEDLKIKNEILAYLKAIGKE